ncbi:BppU family phage baseplate upper protein [Staphylococcus saprophyticus]|nr:BppU family phage baseplate upper protein [Staphylococcus saprophyticus]
MIYKNKDINTNINEKTVELGNIGVNFYTEDEGTASIRIFINWNNKPVDLNKVNMKPVLSLFMQDGSIFEGEKVDVILAEKGLIQYKIPSNVIKHVGKVNAKLFLVNDNESIHVANFNFEISDSGVEEPVKKELSFNLLDEAIKQIVSASAMELLDDTFKLDVTDGLQVYVKENAELFKGDKGEKGEQGPQGVKGDKGEKGDKGDKGDILRYADLTTQQKEDLKSNITDQAVTDFVLEDGTVNTNKLADKSVTPEKTNFVIASRNLFNINTAIKDKAINKSTGLVESLSGWFVSDFIPVEKGQTYKRSKNAEILTYDNNKQYISFYGNSDTALTIPSTTSYVRLNIQSSNISEFQFEKGSTTTEFQEYGITVNDLNLNQNSIKANSISNDKIKDKTLEKSKVSFIQESNNLFNIQTIIKDRSLGDNGSITDNKNYVMSDFIDVTPGETYTTNNKQYGYVLYDSHKNYVGGRGQATTSVTIPSNAKYIRLSITNIHLVEFKFFNILNQDVGDYSIDIINKPNITGAFNQSSSYNKKTFEPISTKKDFELIDILNMSDRLIKSVNSRVTDSFEKTYKHNKKSFSLQTLGNTVPEMRITPSSPFDLVGIQEFDLVVFIEDISKVSKIELGIIKTGGGTWSVSTSDIKEGWNRLRFYVNEGNITTWDKADTLRVIVYTISGTDTNVYVSDLKALKPNKAKIIMVNDHGYKGFKDVAFPKLKNIGVPTTFAINPGRLGTPVTGASSILSQEEIEELAESPFSEFSYHTWNPLEKATKDMSAIELKEESAKCIYFLKKNGLKPDYLWRAAFVQNLAPNHNAIDNMVEAYASWNAGNGFETYPFKDSRNIKRITVHGRSSSDIDSYFETLKKTRCVAIFYTHDINDNGGIHMTNDELNYFVSKIEKGINEGWLEGTTYSELRTRYEIDRNSSGLNDFFSIN